MKTRDRRKQRDTRRKLRESGTYEVYRERLGIARDANICQRKGADRGGRIECKGQTDRQGSSQRDTRR